MLEEKTVLASIEIQLDVNVVNVRREDQILKDGEILSATNHRAAYTRDQKERFIAEVEDPANGGAPGMADPYLVALGWQD